MLDRLAAALDAAMPSLVSARRMTPELLVAIGAQSSPLQMKAAELVLRRPAPAIPVQPRPSAEIIRGPWPTSGEEG